MFFAPLRFFARYVSSQHPSVHYAFKRFQYRPITSKESIPHIHHMNVFNCHVPETVGKTKDFLAKYVTYEGGDCFGSSTPWEWKEYCYALRIASAVVAEGSI